MRQILIVDDAATVRMYHRSILESAGYQVSEALNGIEALEKALQTAFELCVVDVNMPKLDGFGFLRELRGSAIAQMPVIMVSTEANEFDQLQAWRAGANLYVVKPIKPAQLLAYTAFLLGEGQP